MRVIFLDVDGVLNSIASAAQLGTYMKFGPDNVRAVNRLISESGAKVVVSSSWRHLAGYDSTEARRVSMMQHILDDQGVVCEVVGATPTIRANKMSMTVPRRKEIAAWLKGHPEVKEWVVLDDDRDAGPEKFIHTHPSVGLTEDDVNDALSLFDEQTVKS